MLSQYPFLRLITRPLTSEQLRPLDPRCETVQFCEPLSYLELGRVAQLLRSYPDATLRVYGHDTYSTLDFLEQFGDVARVAIEIYQLPAPRWQGQ